MNGTEYNYFLVRAKDGTEYRFGYQPLDSGNPNFYQAHSSRQDGAFDAGGGNMHWLPVRYYLDQIKDTSGNVITITYQATKGTVGSATTDLWVYPQEIDYCSTDTNGPQRKIQFWTRARPTSGNLSDEPAPVNYFVDQLLDSIDESVQVNGQWSLVRKYVFGYDYAPHGSTNYPNAQTYQDAGFSPNENKKCHLVLTSLTECDGTATPGPTTSASGPTPGPLSGNTLPSTTFTYTIFQGWVGDNGALDRPIPLLTQVNNGYGGMVSYTYSTTQTTATGTYTPNGSYTSRYRDNGGNSSRQSQWWFVNAKTVNDGVGGSFQTTYQYGVSPDDGPWAGWSPKLSAASGDTLYPDWRGFNLVAAIESVDGSGNQKVTESRFYRGGFYWNVAANITRSDGWTVGDIEELRGLIYEVRSFDDVNIWNTFSDGAAPTGKEWTVWTLGSTTLYKPKNLPSTDQEDWNVYVLGKGSAQTFRGTSYLLKTFTYDWGANPPPSTSYGNLTEIKEFDSNTSTWIRHTKRYYYPGDNTANFDGATAPTSDQYVVDRLAAENLYSYDPNNPNGDGIPQQYTWYCYDGSYAWNTTIGSGQNGDNQSYHGLLTLVRRWESVSGQYLDTSYGYDAYGNRTSAQRWNSLNSGSAGPPPTNDSRLTTTTYDTTYHTFKTGVTNPKNQTTSYNYDPKFGTLLSTTDPNSATTTYQYDGFGRVIAVWAPLDDASQLGAATTLINYQITPGQPYRIQIGRRKDAGGSLFAKRAFEWRFYDGRGKLVQTQADFDRSQVPIRAQDLNEVRNGVLKYTTTSTGQVTAGASLIKASDFNGLEISLQTLWSNQKLGSLTAWSGSWNAAWSSGVTPGGASWGTGKTPIYGSDLVDLRQWLNAYELAVPVTQTSFTNRAGTVHLVNRFYDGRGLLQGESVPHLLTSLPVCGQYQGADRASSSIPQTTHTSDALKRPLTRVQPDGASTYQWTYSGFTTTTVDENNHQKATIQDALGRTVKAQDFTGSSLSTYTLLDTTTYGYDVQDRLVTIQDTASHTTTIDYDSLGRKTQLIDPDLGSWRYYYPGQNGLPAPSATNPLWLVAQQIDAKGQALGYGYDALDRITSKSGPSLSVGYGYDATSEGNAGIGRRTSMSDGQGQATYTYDLRGRLIELARPIGGTTYHLAMTYDAQDRPLTLTYPAQDGTATGDVLTYVYGDHGKPISLVVNGFPLVLNATYNALLKPTTLPLGNGLQTTWQYYGSNLDYSYPNDPNKWYGLPYQVQTGSLQEQSFPVSPLGYDNLGNPTGIAFSDHVNETFEFSYNELDQLLAMSGSASEGFGSYLQGNADIGNLLQLGSIPLSYGAVPQPHTPSSAGSLTYGYDANGNRASDSLGNAFSYDAENRLTAVSGQVSLLNTYDGDGVRLLRTANSVQTLYVGDWFEVTGNVLTAYYPFNGQPVACKQGSSFFYLHHDQVGSLVSVSDANAREVASLRFWPFGGLRTLTYANGYTALPTDRLFTGQIRDLGDDRFSFFKSRYYDATIGKFQSPDSIVPNAKNPQTLNRYAYALDNPLRMNDPTGHDAQNADLNVSLQDFQKMTWKQREQWLARFQSEYKTGGWFNNVAGILDYFSKSPTFANSAYMKRADAGVLQAIEDGMAAYLRYRSLPAGTEHDAAAKWQAFFIEQQGSNPSFQRESPLWGTAEQAGVQYGLAIASPSTAHEARMSTVFVDAGDTYRWEVTHGFGMIVDAGSHAYVVTAYPFDPRGDAAFVDSAATAFETAEGVYEAGLGVVQEASRWASSS